MSNKRVRIYKVFIAGIYTGQYFYNELCANSYIFGDKFATIKKGFKVIKWNIRQLKKQ